VSQPPSRTRHSTWIEAAEIVLGVRILFFALALLAAGYLASGTGAPNLSLSIWERWDASIFFRIAEFGYTGSDTDPHATAFFPAFPLILRGLHGIGLSYLAAGLLVTTAATVVAGAFLVRLVDEEPGEGSGRRALLYMTLFPTAVFLIAPYSEALFLAGAIPAFYYARRGRWLLAAVPTAVAMSARAAGLFLLFGLLWEFVRQRDYSAPRVATAAAAAVIGLLPLAAYTAFLAHATGEPFYFLTDQRLGWGREFVGPVQALANTWDTWEGATYPTNWVVAWRGEIVAAVAGLGFVAWALVKREWGYAAYMGIFLLALMTSSWYYSIPRMLLSFFPIFVLLADFSGGREDRHEWLLLALAPLAALGVIVFTRGAWFY
jgi:hypothetical protein